MGHWSRVLLLVFRGKKCRFLQTPDLSALHNFISASFLGTIWKYLEWVSAESPAGILNYKISCWPSIPLRFQVFFFVCLFVWVFLMARRTNWLFICKHLLVIWWPDPLSWIFCREEKKALQNFWIYQQWGSGLCREKGNCCLFPYTALPAMTPHRLRLLIAHIAHAVMYSPISGWPPIS